MKSRNQKAVPSDNYPPCASEPVPEVEKDEVESNL